MQVTRGYNRLAWEASTWHRVPSRQREIGLAELGRRYKQLRRSKMTITKHEPLTFARLQSEQRSWVEHNFPGREPYYPLLGAVEELGELAHAHLKSLQGIRGTQEEHRASAADAVADTIIFLSDYCSAMGFDLQQIVEQTWAKVQKRDWIADPQNGGNHE
jgi:NTP pyrophosphatase (non-canonical NTP hydrolase)